MFKKHHVLAASNLLKFKFQTICISSWYETPLSVRPSTRVSQQRCVDSGNLSNGFGEHSDQLIARDTAVSAPVYLSAC